MHILSMGFCIHYSFSLVNIELKSFLSKTVGTYLVFRGFHRAFLAVIFEFSSQKDLSPRFLLSLKIGLLTRKLPS